MASVESASAGIGQPRFTAFVSLMLGLIVAFGLLSQAGKYHERGYVIEHVDQRRQELAERREKTLMVIGATPVEPEATVEEYVAPVQHPLHPPRPLTPPAPPRPVQVHHHVVRQHETLYGLALKIYGDGDQWRRILKANPGLNPGRMPVGKRITIPSPTHPTQAFLSWSQSQRAL